MHIALYILEILKLVKGEALTSLSCLSACSILCHNGNPTTTDFADRSVFVDLVDVAIFVDFWMWEGLQIILGWLFGCCNDRFVVANLRLRHVTVRETRNGDTCGSASARSQQGASARAERPQRRSFGFQPRA